MSDYIKREDAYKYVDEQGARVFTGCTVAEAIKMIIKETPSADVVEVVRCRECKYDPYEPRPFASDEKMLCYGWCLVIADRIMQNGKPHDGYCSCGKRKGEE